MRLIFQQILIKNIKSSFIGLRPIWGSFFNKIKLKTSNPLLSAFGRFEAHFSTNLNLKHKIPFYRPSADLGLIFQQISIKNIKSPFIGLRPIWGSFFNKIKLKTLYPFLSAFGRFEAHFSTNFNQKHQILFYRPSADLGLIFQQN